MRPRRRRRQTSRQARARAMVVLEGASQKAFQSKVAQEDDGAPASFFVKRHAITDSVEKKVGEVIASSGLIPYSPSYLAIIDAKEGQKVIASLERNGHAFDAAVANAFVDSNMLGAIPSAEIGVPLILGPRGNRSGKRYLGLTLDEVTSHKIANERTALLEHLDIKEPRRMKAPHIILGHTSDELVAVRALDELRTASLGGSLVHLAGATMEPIMPNAEGLSAK